MVLPTEPAQWPPLYSDLFPFNEPVMFMWCEKFNVLTSLSDPVQWELVVPEGRGYDGVQGQMRS